MRYIIKIKDNAYLDQERAKLVATTNVTVVNTLENVQCIHIDCAESVIDTIDKTGINWINQDYEMIMHGSRSTTMTAGNYWHLDAITKRDFTTYNNNQYSYPDTLGKNTDIYVVDSGVTCASYLPTGDLRMAQVTWASFASHWNLTLDYGIKEDFTSEEPLSIISIFTTSR